MVDEFEGHRAELSQLCARFCVARLELFGSAASGEGFDPRSSDLDFIVEFLPGQSMGPWLKHYFEFRDALSGLFGQEVDVVIASAMRNPYFIEEANRTREVLYAA